MDAAEALHDLLATHADALQALLPAHLWPVRPFEVKQFGPLTKYTLGEARPGVWAMLHHLTEPDAPDAPPHDHPCNFASYGVKGSYVERVYSKGHRYDVRRPAQSCHRIEASTIHSLIALPEGDCWTYCEAGPVVREWRHYPELI